MRGFDGDGRQRRGGSFVVRVWEEPRGSAEAERPLRAWVRDLRTGEEYGMSDASAMLELLERGAARRAATPDG